MFVACSVMVAVASMLDDKLDVDPKFMLVTDTLASAGMVAVHVEPLLDVVLVPTGHEVEVAYPY